MKAREDSFELSQPRPAGTNMERNGLNILNAFPEEEFMGIMPMLSFISNQL